MPLRRFLEDGGGDDRQDDGTRDRIREIQAGLLAWQERVDHRYRRVAFGLMGLVVGALVAVMIGYALLQGQRWDAINLACDARNQQAEATVLLLLDVGAQEDTVLKAKLRYPHTPPLAHREGARIVAGPSPGYDGPMSCGEMADDQVGRFRL